MARDAQNDADRHGLLRAIAAHSPMPLRVRPSAGSSCTFCREPIDSGSLEYEIKVGRSTIVADDDCYHSFLQEIVEAPSSS
jgi:hypothetical protein